MRFTVLLTIAFFIARNFLVCLNHPLSSGPVWRCFRLRASNICTRLLEYHIPAVILLTLC
ncbi:hypothetical protein KC19_2G117700 [Ceratodon purpureus]|uniref:Uncharacterized protein n=1 Tax=Ceratodon purpureus TaxID=3225 RepID=A0A8T0IWR2_CERPU|nr:hypothetical protein KC19_2G117700 [Ceratodon purpureus]